MFHLTLIPQRRDDTLSLSASAGHILTINNAVLDLSVIPEGALLPADAVGCGWLVGDIERRDGTIHLTLILPHGPIPWPAPPEAQAVLDPAPILVTAPGPITLPAWTPATEDTP